MSRAIILVVGMLACAGVAAAQTPELDRARIAILEQELQTVRLQALDAQRAAYAAQAQLRTEQSVSALEAARAGVSASAVLPPAPLPYDSLPPAAAASASASAYSLGGVPAASVTRVAPIENRQAADADRLLALQGEAIARSNARILAIRPAL